MSVEIMLNAVNLCLLLFNTKMHKDKFCVFSMAVAAAEVAVGLAILVSIFEIWVRLTSII
jgi:NADH-quinone oxidoreductase subunit K